MPTWLKPRTVQSPAGTLGRGEGAGVGAGEGREGWGEGPGEGPGEGAAVTTAPPASKRVPGGWAQASASAASVSPRAHSVLKAGQALG